MKTVDERVVEMRFDNKQFEEGTKKTLSTITRLKEALKFSDSEKSLNALQKTANNIRLDGMVSGIRSLERRFSTLGIVGMRVIQNLTDSMMGQFSRAVAYTQDAIVSGGIRRAMNIENAHFQLQALLKDEEKVQAVMDNAMESVDGTAYAYDEAAKAASMFAASGLEAGEDMMRALKGVTGVAAMTNSEYQAISDIFTTVAGNGRLMGDQLLQLSSRGLNAAATIADFFNKVSDGTTDTSDSIKSAIDGLTEGVTVSEKEIREWVSQGQISFAIFAEAMNDAFGESAERANETFTGALSNMKSALSRIGAEFVSPLVVQNGALVELFNTMRVRINDLKKELTFDKEKGNVNALSKQFTDSVIAMAKSASTFLKDADISGPVKILYNNVETIKNLVRGLSSILPPVGKAFSKVFSDFKMDSLVSFSEYLSKITERFKLTSRGSTVAYRVFRRLFKAVNEVIEGFKALSPAILKMNYSTKVLRIFNRVLKSLENLGKNIVIVLRALSNSFKTVFDNIEVNPIEFLLNTIRDLAMSLVHLTERLQISEEGAKNLQDGFTGILNVVKLLGEGFLGLLSAVLPIEGPMTSIGTSLLSLFGLLGRTMTAFAEWVRESTAVNAICGVLVKAIGAVITVIGNLIDWVNKSTKGFTNFGVVGKIFTNLKNGIKETITYSIPFVTDLTNKIFGLKKGLLSISSEDVINGIRFIGDLFAEFGRNMMKIDLSDPSSIIESFKNAIKGVIDLARTNPGFDAFVTNIVSFFENLKNGLSAGNLTSKVDGVKGGLSSLVEWVKNSFLPMMQNLTAGDVLAAGTSFAGIYSFLKAVKAFTAIGEAAGKFGDILTNIGGVLESYQKNIQSTTLLKIAAAIAILSASLVLLSFTDTEKMLAGAKALAMVGAVIVGAMYVLAKRKEAAKGARQTVKQIDGATMVLSTAVRSFFANMKQANIKKTIQAIGLTVAMIAGSIIELAKIYKKNKEGFQSAVAVLVTITGIFGALMLAVTILNGILKGDGSAFLNTAKGIQSMATALLLSVMAIKRMMKIEFPSDWEVKIGILSAMFLALAAVAVILTLIGRIGGGNEGPGKTLVFMALALIASIKALNKMFKIELPNDWETKLGILLAMLGALALVMVTLGFASRASKGSIKAGGSITALSVFVGAIVSALTVLSLIDEDKLMGGAKAVGLILVALAVSLSQAAKIGEKGSGETVKAMASVIGTITASLAILALVSWDKLAAATVALDSVLLSLAAVFSQVGKSKDSKAFLNIFAMVAMTVTIAYMLYKMAEQPWDGMLASGIALGSVLLAMSKAFNTLEESNKVDLKTIGEFLLMTLAVVPIASALYILSNQPWDGMLASGASISLTILAFGKAFEMIAKSEKVDLKTIGEFLLLTLSVIPIAGALYILSDRPWEGMLTACGTLSLTILAFSKAFGIIAKAEKVDLKQVANFLLLTVSIIPIAASLYILSEQPWDGMLSAAVSISLVLAALSAVTYILAQAGKGGGSSIKAALIGIAMLDLLIADLTAVLVAMGALLQDNKVQTLMEAGAEGFATIGEAIGNFFGGIIGGFVGEASKGIEQVGTSLSNFMENASPFFDGIKNVDSSIMESVKMLAESLLLIMGSGFLGKLAGKESVTKFSNQLPEFGEDIKSFAKNAGDIDPSSVEGAATAAKIMAEVAKNLPYSNKSLIGKIFGKKSLKEFAEELKEFGPGIAEFAETVKGVTSDMVEGAASAGSLMSKFANSLGYDSGSLAGKIFGKNTLSQFATELNAFGPEIVTFAETVKDVTPESVQGAASAGELMAVLANKLPNNLGSLMGKIFGKKSFTEFGSELVSFGTSLSSFAESVSGIKKSSVAGAATISETFANIANAIPQSGGLISLFTGNKSIDSFGKKLVTFGNKFKEFCDVIASIQSDSVVSTTSRISGLIKVLKDAGENGVTEFINAFNKKEGSISKAIANVINFAIDALKNHNSSFEDQGKASMSSFVSGLSTAGNNVKESTKTVVNYGIAAAEATKDDMMNAGENAGRGFAQGILNTQGDAQAAGRSLGLAAYNAAREALDEHSPSRKMKEVGAFAVLGMVGEMIKNIPKAYDAGQNLGLAALEGATNGTSELVSYIDSNWNLDPLIKPRIDLRELQRSGDQVNRMFNDSVYTVRANAMSVSQSMNGYSRNSTQTGILNMLDELKDSISQIGSGGDSYSINGLSYTEGSEVSEAIKTLIRATNVKRRV